MEYTHTELCEHLKNLRLYYTADNLESLMNTLESRPPRSVLSHIAALELVEQKNRNINRRMAEARLRYYARVDLLVIDELGYLSYQDKAADMLFEVVARRYERAPIVLTTNLMFGEWPQIFPGAACVSAIIDRLIHHCEILQIKGPSFRKTESGAENK